MRLSGDDPLDLRPRDESAAREAFAASLELLRSALIELEAVPDAELEPITRRLRDNTRAMLKRYDDDRYDNDVFRTTT